MQQLANEVCLVCRSLVKEVFAFFTHTWMLNTENNNCNTNVNNSVNNRLSSCSAEDHEALSPLSPADVDLGSGGGAGAVVEPLAGSHFVSVSTISSLSSTNSYERPARESDSPGGQPIEICV